MTVRVNQFKIDEPPTYDQLKGEFQSKYNIQVWNELIASMNYAIGTYTNNEQNTIWSVDYIQKEKAEFAVTIIGVASFIASYFGVMAGLILGQPVVWQLSLFGFGISVMCVVLFLCFWVYLARIKRKYAADIELLVQNALDLLNQKYANQCVYSVVKVRGSSLFDFKIVLHVSIKIKLLGANLRYVENNIVGVEPYTENHVNKIASMEGQNESVMDTKQPLV